MQQEYDTRLINKICDLVSLPSNGQIVGENGFFTLRKIQMATLIIMKHN